MIPSTRANMTPVAKPRHADDDARYIGPPISPILLSDGLRRERGSEVSCHDAAALAITHKRRILDIADSAAIAQRSCNRAVGQSALRLLISRGLLTVIA